MPDLPPSETAYILTGDQEVDKSLKKLIRYLADKVRDRTASPVTTFDTRFAFDRKTGEFTYSEVVPKDVTYCK